MPHAAARVLLASWEQLRQAAPALGQMPLLLKAQLDSGVSASYGAGVGIASEWGAVRRPSSRSAAEGRWKSVRRRRWPGRRDVAISARQAQSQKARSGGDHRRAGTSRGLWMGGEDWAAPAATGEGPEPRGFSASDEFEAGFPPSRRGATYSPSCVGRCNAAAAPVRNCRAARCRRAHLDHRLIAPGAAPSTGCRHW